MSGSPADDWVLSRVAGTAAEVHHLDPSPSSPRSVWLIDTTDRALVLGSSQPESSVDRAAAAAAGIAVVRRRSGGGAVLVDQAHVVWVDVIITPGAAEWDDDVGRSAMWLGRVWAAALADLDLGPAIEVHEPPMLRSPLASTVCFVGRGPGEVSVGGRKVVGIAQRRTRSWARFQCAALLTWEPEAMLALLSKVSEADARAVASAATGLGVDRDPLLTAFLSHLDTAATTR